ncbi:MAG: ABC transporter substrate-binding protein [Pseudomonadota bacterium]
MATKQSMQRSVIPAWLAAVVLCFIGNVAQAQSPNDVIAEASQLLADQLTERRDEFAADKDALYTMVNDIILPRFDRRYAAQLVLGRNWRTATDDQRNAFIDAYYNSLLQQYADGVLEFDQDRIKILPFRGDESKPRVTVKTTVRLNDGTQVPVDYGLVRRDSGWMVFDVVIEGISYVRNFRAEINSEIQTSSLDAVIARLARSAGGVDDEARTAE